MSFVRKIVSAKPNLQVVEKDVDQNKGVPDAHKQIATSFYKFMEHYIDHHPSPKEFAQSLLAVMEQDNQHGNHHLTLHSYSKEQFDAVGKFLSQAKKEIETMYNKEKQQRKKK